MIISIGRMLGLGKKIYLSDKFGPSWKILFGHFNVLCIFLMGEPVAEWSCCLTPA